MKKENISVILSIVGLLMILTAIFYSYQHPLIAFFVAVIAWALKQIELLILVPKP